MLNRTRFAVVGLLAFLLVLPVFTGPIIWAKSNPGTGFRGPWVDRLVFNFMPSVDSEILALKTGSIQLMTAPLT
ncbi:MAG: hypothetical protein E6K95_03675, partial [Thaumarchaeota archaeon]